MTGQRGGGKCGENIHSVASVGPGTLTKTIKLYSRLDNFDYILQPWNRMEKSTLLQCEPGWNRCVQCWVMLVEHEPSILLRSPSVALMLH